MNRTKRKTNVKGNTGKATSAIRNGSTATKKTSNQQKPAGTLNEKKSEVNNNKDVEKKTSNQSKSPTPTKGLPSSIEQATPIIYVAPKKLERSNTFFITRKISKIYNSLTGSKTSLNKIPENESDSIGISSQAITPTTPSSLSSPFKFVRSASLATIPLRKSQHRRSMVDDTNNNLHELNEDMGGIKGSLAPISATNVNRNQASIDTIDGEQLYEGVTLRHKSNNPELYSSQKELDRKSSTSSFLSSLKRTFSVTAAKRKSHNARWSNSLLNLQQIDFMVSYEDLSFINYDKYNKYEETLKRQVSQQPNSVEPNVMGINKMQRQRSSPATTATTVKTNAIAADASDEYFENYPQVKRRVKKVHNSMNFITNFDGPKNVYRQSIDDEKLRMLNSLNQSLATVANTARQSTYRNEIENEYYKRHSDTYNFIRSSTSSLQQHLQSQPSQQQQQKSQEQKSMGRKRRTTIPMSPITTMLQEKKNHKETIRRTMSMDDVRTRVTEIDVFFQNEFKVSLVFTYSLILLIFRHAQRTTVHKY